LFNNRIYEIMVNNSPKVADLYAAINDQQLDDT